MHYADTIKFALYIGTILCSFGDAVFALKCYSCDSETHGSTCYDPLRYLSALECIYTANYRASPEMNGNGTFSNVGVGVGANLMDDSHSTNFQCAQFEIVDFYNRKKYIRSCQRRDVSANFCRDLERNGRFRGYGVTRCDICYSDYCNSSTNVQLALLFNFAFFIIFYYST